MSVEVSNKTLLINVLLTNGLKIQNGRFKIQRGENAPEL